MSVDRSAATIMCVVQLGDAVSQAFGPDLTATHVLPLLSPLLVVPVLPARQFKEFMAVLQVRVALVLYNSYAHM